MAICRRSFYINDSIFARVRICGVCAFCKDTMVDFRILKDGRFYCMNCTCNYCGVPSVRKEFSRNRTIVEELEGIHCKWHFVDRFGYYKWNMNPISGLLTTKVKTDVVIRCLL